jgi:hypothetical protein
MKQLIVLICAGTLHQHPPLDSVKHVENLPLTIDLDAGKVSGFHWGEIDPHLSSAKRN